MLFVNFQAFKLQKNLPCNGFQPVGGVFGRIKYYITRILAGFRLFPAKRGWASSSAPNFILSGLTPLFQIEGAITPDCRSRSFPLRTHIRSHGLLGAGFFASPSFICGAV